MEVGSIVMPGDVLLDVKSLENSNEKIIFGPGVRRVEDKIIAIKCGILKQNTSKLYYVDHHQMRYIPNRAENVIGVVMKKGSDEAMLDIGSNEPAVVDLLSFEGSTKRNKPQLKVGDILFAKVLNASKDMEPEVVCIDKYGKSSGFGVLPDGGFVIHVSLEYCRKLLLPESPILRRLGLQLPFEVAVGMNGRVWVKASSTERTLVVVQAIQVLEYADTDDMEAVCEGMSSANLI